MLEAIVFWTLMLVVIPILLLVLMMMLGKRSAIFSEEPKQENIAFVVVGEKLVHILSNVTGHRRSEERDPSGRYWIIRQRTRSAGESLGQYKKTMAKEWEESFFDGVLWGTKWAHKLIWRRLGIRFIGWFWFQKKIHEFFISIARLKESAELPDNASLKDMIQLDEGDKTRVRSLRFIIPRPVLVRDVELPGDNGKINLLLLVTFQVVIPTIPVFELKGKGFLPLLDAVINTAVTDFFAKYRVTVDGKKKSLTLDRWLETARGENSPLERALRPINASPAYIKSMEPYPKLHAHLLDLTGSKKTKEIPAKLAEDAPLGIIARYGLAITSVRIQASQAHPDTAALEKAIQAKKLAELIAAGVREEAMGRADAITSIGKAEGERMDSLAKSLRAAGVPEEHLAATLNSFFRNEALPKALAGNTIATTLLLQEQGGTPPSILINPNANKGGDS